MGNKNEKMNSMTIVSKRKLVNYIRRNPGLTTVQLCNLLRGANKTRYTKTHFNSRLVKLVKQGLIVRVKKNASNSDTAKAWRHYHYPHEIDKGYPEFPNWDNPRIEALMKIS